MATIDVILWVHQANRDGTHSLRLRVTKNRKTSYKSLGYSINKKDWDENRKRVKSSHPNSARLNNFITKRLAEAQDAALEAECKDKHASTATIRAKIDGNRPSDFFEFAEAYLERFNNPKSIGTLKAKQAVLAKLKRFNQANTLPFTEITYDFLIAFREHLKTHGNNPNTRTANLKKIRSIYNEAFRTGLVDRSNDPFCKIRMESNKTDKTRLTRDELDKIRALKYEAGSVIWHVKNIFLLCFNFMGMRIGDALTLKANHIESGRLRYSMRKTGDRISVRLTPEATAILDMYELHTKNPDDYIFPLVKSTKPKDLYILVKSATALYNQYLRDIAKDSGIQKHISSHVARHSWAQQAKLLDVNIGVIQQAFGHASSRTTENYMEDFDSCVIDAANEKIVTGV